jgi:hypothetical protein
MSGGRITPAAKADLLQDYFRALQVEVTVE